MILKLDIKGYFMSLRHDKIYERVCWGLDQQYEDRPKKRYFQEVHKGVEFLGAVIYPYHTVPTKRFKNNFCKNLAEVGMGYRDIAAVTSYLGRLKHMNGKKLAHQVFERMGWWYNY